MNKLFSPMAVALSVTLSSTLAPLANAGGDAAKGQALTAVCAACHGQDGNSPMAIYPKLAGLGEKYLLKQLLEIKSGARPVVEMTGLLTNLSDQDLADIAAYFNSKTTQLSGSKEMKVLVNSGEEVDALALGTKLYRAGNKEAGIPACSGCHSPRGQGNSPAGYPRLSGQHSDYVIKQLKAFKDGTRKDPLMTAQAAPLSDADIANLAAYYAGLK